MLFRGEGIARTHRNTPIFDFSVKDRQTTRQGLKRKYEQMEWQNEQIRFFSNSGVFGVGSNGNY